VFARAAFWDRDGALDGATPDGAILEAIVVGARVGSSNNGIKPEKSMSGSCVVPVLLEARRRTLPRSVLDMVNQWSFTSRLNAVVVVER
jgi:hypothetical protein